jgi:diaminobutyrate-2-oxoglutarate transaminase
LPNTGPSGADAVEAALKLAKKVTGRSGIISFSGGYHGMTHGALSVTGNLSPKEAVDGMMPEVQFMPYHISTVAHWVSTVKRA